MTEYVTVNATITDRWGGSEVVFAGYQPRWAWDIDRCAEWRKVQRKLLLADRTSDPRGWRVAFSEEVAA